MSSIIISSPKGQLLLGNHDAHQDAQTCFSVEKAPGRVLKEQKEELQLQANPEYASSQKAMTCRSTRTDVEEHSLFQHCDFRKCFLASDMARVECGPYGAAQIRAWFELS